MKNDLAVAMGRVSTNVQRMEGSSLTDQDITFRNYANKLGHAIVHGFSFNESASTSQKRTRFQEVIAYVKANDIGHLYVENTTRLSRDTVDLQYIKDLYENHDLTFHFISENYTLNKNLDGASKMFLIMRLMQGEMMIDDLRRKMRDSMLKKVERGEWPGRSPYGYKFENKALIVDDTRAQHVKKLFARRAEGATLRELADELNNLKARPPRGTKWHFQSVEGILTQVAYNSQIDWKGLIYPAKHPRLVPPALFESVKKSFATTSRKNVANGQLLSGFIRNPEGRLFTPEVQKGNVYYSAPTPERKRVWLSEAKAFDLINPQIMAMHWTSEFGEFVKDTARDMVARNKSDSDQMIWRREKELSELRGKALQVYDDKLDGTITKEMYQIKSAEIQSRQVVLEQELRGLRSDDRMFLKNVEQITDTFENLPITYAKSDNVGKSQILRDLCTGFLYDGANLRPQFKQTFAVFINTKVDKLKRARVRYSSSMRPLLDAYRTLLAA